MAITELLSRWFNTSEVKPMPTSHPFYQQYVGPLLKKAKDNQSYYYRLNFSWTQEEIYQALKKEDGATKKAFVAWAVEEIYERSRKVKRKSNWEARDPDRLAIGILDKLSQLLLQSKLPFTINELQSLFAIYRKAHEKEVKVFYYWPIGWTIKQLEQACQRELMTAKQADFFHYFLQQPIFQNARSSNYGSDLANAKAKLEKILYEVTHQEHDVIPVYLDKEDDFGVYMNAKIAALPLEKKSPYYALLALLQQTKGAKPTRRFEKRSTALIKEIGKRTYKKWLHEALQYLIDLRAFSREQSYSYGLRTYTYATVTYLYDRNNQVAKGLVWTLLQVQDNYGLQLVERLAVRAFKKIPGVGAAATAVGNACFYVLASAKGMEGLAQLSRLRVKIKQRNAKNKIDQYLETQAEERGVSRQALEEAAISDLGLVDGQQVFDFGDYQLKLCVAGVGKTLLQWIKPDGKTQKSVPTIVKQQTKFKNKLKQIKITNKSIQQALTLERDKLDQSYLQQRTWSFARFDDLFIQHGLLSYLGKRLIWRFEMQQDQFVHAIWRQGTWRNAKGETVLGLENSIAVKLWHPIYSETDEIIAWRDLIQTWQITQPMKQAFREIYLLTEAEINTDTYSNRMAGHLIKQHQFNALAGARDWRYSLIGAWDHGMDCVARKSLPAYQMHAEFWTIELTDSEDYHTSGVWTYMGTDQVRFVSPMGVAIPLVDIPPLVLSEVMRDVDLFVGVASVGNDPAWQDSGGLQQYRDYWHDYSFGSLRETAKVRKQILERILPMLKIRDVAHLDGKFLVVKGKIRTYKIHLGSTNILMEPNDQYLCIVAARSHANQADKVFLPFEGDRGFSILLSKAFLLAEDDKITDRSITSQLRRKSGPHSIFG